MKVYLIHFGFATDSETGEKRPAGAVTFRRDKEQAVEIAKFLDSKRMELAYYEFLASQSNEALGGGVDRLKATHSDGLRGDFLEFMKTEPQYEVTELTIEGEDEEKLQNELNAAQEKLE